MVFKKLKSRASRVPKKYIGSHVGNSRSSSSHIRKGKEKSEINFNNVLHSTQCIQNIGISKFTSIIIVSEIFHIFLIIFKNLRCLNLGLPRWLSGKESACSAGNAGDVGLIPGSGKSPGGGTGNPLQYSCLENPLDREVWWATVHRTSQRRTRLSSWAYAHTRVLMYAFRASQLRRRIQVLHSYMWLLAPMVDSTDLENANSLPSLAQEASGGISAVVQTFPASLSPEDQKLLQCPAVCTWSTHLVKYHSLLSNFSCLLGTNSYLERVVAGDEHLPIGAHWHKYNRNSKGKDRSGRKTGESRSFNILN